MFLEHRLCQDVRPRRTRVMMSLKKWPCLPDARCSPCLRLVVRARYSRPRCGTSVLFSDRQVTTLKFVVFVIWCLSQQWATWKGAAFRWPRNGLRSAITIWPRPTSGHVKYSALIVLTSTAWITGGLFTTSVSLIFSPIPSSELQFPKKTWTLKFCSVENIFSCKYRRNGCWFRYVFNTDC
jgi:hypothetical protein